MHGEIPHLSLAPIGRKCQLNVAKCQDKSCDEPYLSGSEETMDFQIKLFSWPDRGNHVIMIVRGLIDTEGCNEMFRKIGEMTLPVLDCKVLIDLIDAKCELQQSEIVDFANGLKANLWPHSRVLSDRQVDFSLTLVIRSQAIVDHSYPIQNLTSKFQCLVRWALCALCAIAYLTVTNGVNAADVGAKRVLMISTGSRLAPGFIIVDQQLLQIFGKITSPRIEIYPENLDLVRFPSERYGQIFSEYLTAKYAAHPPDLVILVYIGNLGTAGKVLQQLFLGTPVIVAGFTEENISCDQFGSLVIVIAQRVDPRATMEL